MPKKNGKKYSAGQKKIARVTAPRNKITASDLKALRKNKKKKKKW